jgi:hypothetical protein
VEEVHGATCPGGLKIGAFCEYGGGKVMKPRGEVRPQKGRLCYEIVHECYTNRFLHKIGGTVSPLYQN